MPNWIPNRLFVSGPAREIKAFKEAASEKGQEGKNCRVISFHCFCPIPTQRQLRRLYRRRMPMTERHILWCEDHWGTKWNSAWSRLARDADRSLLYTFFTANDPPTPWVKVASGHFPKLRFSLHSWIDGDSTRWITHIAKGKVRVFRTPRPLESDGKALSF